MTASRVEPDFGHDRHNSDPDAANGLKPDLSRVLIVGNSQINRIVVSKIVERSGLKPICEPPPGALRVLPLIFPALVILDGGPDNSDCDSVVAGVLALIGHPAVHPGPASLQFIACRHHRCRGDKAFHHGAVAAGGRQTDRTERLAYWAVYRAEIRPTSNSMTCTERCWLGNPSRG